ncbi:MAG: hypothetical protein IPI50_06855 [Saprospiraceae bacterium]|nr:hypothetical protein [Saprospiraceae bacterium]
MKNALLLLVLSSLCSLSFAQVDLAIGEWATHLPFNAGLSLAQSPKSIFYATDYAILQVSKEDLQTRKLTRTEGLNGSSISCIYFQKENNALVIAYTDGLIDLVTDDQVRSVPDIRIFNNVPIIKNIHKISPNQGDEVFINADYGLSSLNVKTGRISYTLFTPNLKVLETVKFGNQIYMATEKGLYRYEENSSKLIQDFASWELLGNMDGLDPASEYSSLSVFKDQLYIASASQGIMKLNNGLFEMVYLTGIYKVQYLKTGTQYLMAGLACENCNHKVLFSTDGIDWKTKEDECTAKNFDIEEEENGRIWYADERWGFRYSQNPDAVCNSLFVNGPLNKEFYEIKSLSDGIYVASGGIDAVYTYLFRADGIYTYKDRKWDVINQSNVSLFSGLDIRDVLRVAESPDHKKLYFASFQRGIVEYNRDTEEYKLYNEKNSALGVAQGDETRVRVIGLDFSPKDKSLWAAVYLARKPLVSLDVDGTWRSYDLPGFSTEVAEVKVDRNGYKWIVPRREIGVMVFDEGKLDDPTDDRSIVLNSSNSNLQTNKIYTVEVDLDGDVWVGTAEGPVVFECGSSIFAGTCKGSRRKVDQDGIIGFLLETEEILSMDVDGGDRKWFGTRNGVYVQNSIGDVQVYNFNTTNSPLLGNTIYEIEVNQSTGEVWIGTENGIQVYRSEATAAKNVFTEDITSFPNPVPPGYEGSIAIRGLARDARVKITDVSGRLVFETFATGGQALWDGRDYQGRLVSSGTYIVFANSTKDFDVSEGATGRIVLVR